MENVDYSLLEESFNPFPIANSTRMAHNEPGNRLNSSLDMSGLSDLGDLELTISASTSNNPSNDMDIPNFLKEMEIEVATERIVDEAERAIPDAVCVSLNLKNRPKRRRQPPKTLNIKSTKGQSYESDDFID